MMRPKRRQTATQGHLTSRKNFRAMLSFFVKPKKSTEKSKKEKKQECKGCYARRKRQSKWMSKGKSKVSASSHGSHRCKYSSNSSAVPNKHLGAVARAC